MVWIHVRRNEDRWSGREIGLTPLGTEEEGKVRQELLAEASARREGWLRKGKRTIGNWWRIRTGPKVLVKCISISELSSIKIGSCFTTDFF
jgi:hypothetical protein